MTTPLIELENVDYKVTTPDGAPLSIIEGVNLTVYPKETLAIVGRSGSGKSTLMSLMAGLELASSGKLQLLGQNLANSSEDARALLRAQQVSFIFQNFQLLPSMTALENLMMPLELFGEPNAKQRALEVIEKVGLAHRLDHLPGQLSGGEQQRVAIARALITNPKIIFADEPTGSLDEETAEMIQQLLFELNEQFNTTLVIVTHDMELANLCKKQYQIHQGNLRLI